MNAKDFAQNVAEIKTDVRKTLNSHHVTAGQQIGVLGNALIRLLDLIGTDLMAEPHLEQEPPKIIVPAHIAAQGQRESAAAEATQPAPEKGKKPPKPAA